MSKFCHPYGSIPTFFTLKIFCINALLYIVEDCRVVALSDKKRNMDAIPITISNRIGEARNGHRSSFRNELLEKGREWNRRSDQNKSRNMFHIRVCE